MMMNRKKPTSLHEAIRNLWKIRIMLEKNYTENCATWMAKRIESLIDTCNTDMRSLPIIGRTEHSDSSGQTLLPYKNMFRQDYDIARVTTTIAYWDIEQQAWRTFQLENFLEWSPVC